MRNERGISLAETLLTVVIFFTIASTLIPVSYQLQLTLHNKKLELFASEVAYEGVKEVFQTSTTSGIKRIDDVDFYWNYSNQEICVSYENMNMREQRKCINQNGEIR